MEEYFDIKVKNHKKLNKKILFVEYLKEDFTPDSDLMKKMIEHYIDTLNKHDEKLLIILDIRNVKNYDKKIIWEGAGELKKHDTLLTSHSDTVYIINENYLVNELINIVLKVMKSKTPTHLVKDINSALTMMS